MWSCGRSCPPGATASPETRAAATTSSPAGSAGTRARSAGSRSGAGVTVRRLVREAGDGFHSELVPGLRSGADAERLADELAFATARLAALERDPPGLYREVADRAHDLEERTWLAVQIAYLSPLDGSDPFAGVQRARVAWSSGDPPALDGAPTGPRTAHDPARGGRTIEAYRAWAVQAGSQAAGFAGQASWTPERRFDRAFERLGARSGLDRGARFDLLVTLGRLGLYELRAGSLHIGGGDPVTLAAKRILGIGDPLLLERRSAELAQACGVALEALDLGFFNWERGSRATIGLAPDTAPDETARRSARVALRLA